MTHSVQTELRMESRLSEMPALIQRLRSDPELLARIRGREADFLIAMREALANAVTHGNQSDGWRGFSSPMPARLTKRCRLWYGMKEMGSSRSIFSPRTRCGKTRKGEFFLSDLRWMKSSFERTALKSICE
jgi:hypothetical protein